MNPCRAASITSLARNAESPGARRDRVSYWHAVVLGGFVSAGLAAQGQCNADDRDDALRRAAAARHGAVRAQQEILFEQELLLQLEIEQIAIRRLVVPKGGQRLVVDDDDDDAVQRVAEVERFVLSEQQFDQMVFGGGVRRVLDGGGRQVVDGQGSADGVRRQMESILDGEIRTVDARCSLNEAQKKKLQLAGRGDIARWLSRVSELRAKFTATPMDQRQYQAIMVELRPLRTVPQLGPFGESSLLRKTLRTTLSDEQLPRYRALVRERAVQAVENALRILDSQTRTKLVGDNRQKFIDTLVDHGNFPQTNSPYIQYIVWLEADRLEDQLKPLLDETQRLAFQQQVGKARQVEQALRSSGQWPGAQPADDDF